MDGTPFAWRRASREFDHCRPAHDLPDKHGIELQVRHYPPLTPAGQGFRRVIWKSDANTKAALSPPKLAQMACLAANSLITHSWTPIGFEPHSACTSQCSNCSWLCLASLSSFRAWRDSRSAKFGCWFLPLRRKATRLPYSLPQSDRSHSLVVSRC